MKNKKQPPISGIKYWWFIKCITLAKFVGQRMLPQMEHPEYQVPSNAHNSVVSSKQKKENCNALNYAFADSEIKYKNN